jgi:hypothetical protein
MFDSVKARAPCLRVAKWFALIVLLVVVTEIIIAEYLIDEPLRQRTDGPRQRYGEIVSRW